jgi:hypothetical protein
MNLDDRDILELNQLCDATIEGTANAAQRARLEQLLSESEDARAYYVKMADLSASLSHYAGEMQMEEADGRRSMGLILRSNILKMGAVAAAIMLVVLWWAGPDSTKAVKTQSPAASPTEFVARLTGLKDVAWVNNSSLTSGDFLRRGQRLEMASGFAELTFDSGAVLLLQGPAAIHVNSAWDATLRRGSLRANVPPQALGFRVSNSAVEVVDLGTSFSMVADSEGGADVFVLQGEVEASPRGNEDSETILLRTNDSRRFARPGGGASGDPNRTVAKFNTDVSLDRLSKPAKYICWSFDEMQGRAVLPTAINGFSDATFAFGVSARSPAARLGAHADGYRNRALRFNENVTVKARFPGLSGNFARTLAFWVNVPENAPLSGAYSMVAWQGDSGKLASRPVHIAWNRHPEEGALGALRTDFSGGHAIGITPLRDGNWHFITVIFLPGETPDLPVQVKQYVDGRLESNTVTPGKKRSIGGNTRSANSAANEDLLWLGCRLGGNGAKAERFSGQIDELVVVDRGLEPAEIVQLMDGKSIDAALHATKTN